MEPEFITYQKFNDRALADELVLTLEENNIEYLLEEQTSGFDPSLVMNNAPVDYAVKIKSQDFGQVNDLLKENEEKNIGEIDEDYYLFSFTNDELMEVITKADEWSTFDVVLARKILGERGINISDQQLSNINEKRIEELKVVKSLSSTQLIICYLFAIGLGLIGIIIGLHLITYKKIYPDGERDYGYTSNDRWHGKVMLCIGAASFIIALLYKFEVMFN